MIQLIQGDCLEKMKDIPDGSVDMVLCDLPYGTTACKWDTCIPFEPMWEQLKRVTKKNGAIVLFGSQPFTSALVMSNPKMFKYEWVWDKKTATGGALAHLRPMKSHENICVFCKTVSIYNRQWEDFSQDEIKKMRKHDFICKNSETIGIGCNISTGWFDGKRKNPKSVIRINGVTPVSMEKKQGKHPTQKPVALMEYLIKTYTQEGETVLDFTMGSGTTGLACKNLNRNFIGIELDETYFNIAKQRIDLTPKGKE